MVMTQDRDRDRDPYRYYRFRNRERPASASWYSSSSSSSTHSSLEPAPLIPRRSSARHHHSHHHHRHSHSHSHSHYDPGPELVLVRRPSSRYSQQSTATTAATAPGGAAARGPPPLAPAGPLSSHPLGPPQLPPVARVASRSREQDRRRGHDLDELEGEEDEEGGDLAMLYAAYFDDHQRQRHRNQQHRHQSPYGDGLWDPGQQEHGGLSVPPAVRVHWRQNLSVNVDNSPGGIDEVSPLSSSGSARFTPGRISDVSGLGGLSPRPV